MAANGALSAEEFEASFFKPSDNIRLSSGLWSRYLRGEVTPQGAQSPDSHSLIDRFEEKYPGTASVFSHPVWRLLVLDQLLGPEQLRDIYLKLGKTISQQFVRRGDEIWGPAQADQSIFWRSHSSERDRLKSLTNLNGLDGIAVCLIEARMDYFGQHAGMFYNSMLFAHFHCHALAGVSYFRSKRMRSALLLIEGICSAYLYRHLVLGPPMSEEHDELQHNAKAVVRHWANRFNSHIKALSSSSRKVFSDLGHEAWGSPKSAPRIWERIDD